MVLQVMIAPAAFSAATTAPIDCRHEVLERGRPAERRNARDEDQILDVTGTPASVPLAVRGPGSGRCVAALRARSYIAVTTTLQIASVRSQRRDHVLDDVARREAAGAIALEQFSAPIGAPSSDFRRRRRRGVSPAFTAASRV